MKMWQAAYCGMSILLLTVAIGSGYRQIAIEEFQAPKHWLRLLFLICLPAQVWLSLVSYMSALYYSASDYASSSSKLWLVTLPKSLAPPIR